MKATTNPENPSMKAPYPPQTARARRVFTHSQRVAAPPAELFPLLCPVLEYEWIPDWECELVYTASGVAELNCVFQTDREADGGLDTWVISRYEPNQRLAFVRVNPLRTISYDIELSVNDDGSTKLIWTQVVTALSDAGDPFVAAMSEESFKYYIGLMEDLMSKHLGLG